MFPILMDEPDAMTVAPRAWQRLQDAWRGVLAPVRENPGASHEAEAPTALATLALAATGSDTPAHRER